jgi:phosphatidylinositol alpha-1,6-mannosyltransferase
MWKKSRLPILLADDFPPRHGGIQRYMRKLADAMHDLGRWPLVVAPAAPGDADYDAALPFPVVRFAGTSKIERLAREIAALSQRRSTAPDYTISALWFPGAFAASLVPQARRGKLGIITHGSEILRPRGLKHLLMRSVLTRADVVVANSDYTRDLVNAGGVSRAVETVGCGVDDFLAPGPRSASPLVLAVGRLIPRKGFDHLIAAMPIIRAAVPDARCEIFGDGPQRRDLEALARSLDLESVVYFSGAGTDEELRAAYGRAWCFALPCRREGNDVEGFGIVYLEAGIASLPVVGGAASGAAGAIIDGQTGYLVDGTSLEAIAKAVVRLLQDRTLTERMGASGRHRALSEFSWHAIARRIDDLMLSA